jgi:hypothetical protein
MYSRLWWCSTSDLGRKSHRRILSYIRNIIFCTSCRKEDIFALFVIIDAMHLSVNCSVMNILSAVSTFIGIFTLNNIINAYTTCILYTTVLGYWFIQNPQNTKVEFVLKSTWIRHVIYMFYSIHLVWRLGFGIMFRPACCTMI